MKVLIKILCEEESEFLKVIQKLDGVTITDRKIKPEILEVQNPAEEIQATKPAPG